MKIKPEKILHRCKHLGHENRKNLHIASQQLETISFKKVISAKYHKEMLKRKRANEEMMVFSDWLVNNNLNTIILHFSHLS